MKSRVWLLLLLAAVLLLLAVGSDDLANSLARLSTPSVAPAASDSSAAGSDGRTAHTSGNDADPAALASSPTAEAIEPFAPTVAAAAMPLLKFNAAQARVAMRQRWREQDCQMARLYSTPTFVQRREQEWRWLPPDLVEQERRAVAAALTRLTADCPGEITDKAQLIRRSQESQAVLAAARTAGDLYARMEPARRGRDTAELAAEARATMYDVVLSGDMEAIARLGRLDFLLQNDAGTQSIDMFVDGSSLWPMVACDLGMDCGPASRALDQACQQIGNGCGYPNLEALVRDRSPPWQYRLTDQRHREIVVRLRSRWIAGMFDPAPPPQPPPDGRP